MPSHPLQRLIGYNAGEGRSLALAWLYIFTLFLAYYVLRPIRDEMGAAGGVDNLPWLFSATLLSMLILSPLFAALVSRWPRERFIAVAYHFFMANLLLFIVAIEWAPGDLRVWIGRVFFVWVSVFNLFVISIYWSLIVDVFGSERGKQLFGFLATGATLGGIVGASSTSTLVARFGQNGMMVLSILFLELAVIFAFKLSQMRRAERSEIVANEPSVIGGNAWAGVVHTFRSPYLTGIALFILFQTVTATFLYFQQGAIVNANFSDSAERTRFFANIDVMVNTLTLFIQLFLTGRLIKRLGVGVVLCALPFVSLLLFSSLALSVTTALFVAVQVIRRVSNYALSRPTREVLFTVISREDRYKTKNFIDTVIYRGGDQVGSWSYAGLQALGLSMSGIAAVAIPITFMWLLLGLWLGLQQRHREQSGCLDSVSTRNNRGESS